MDKNLINKLLLISSCGLMIAGVIFLMILLWEGVKSRLLLGSALGCIVLANLFHIIKNQFLG